jgi:hypothetical protein
VDRWVRVFALDETCPPETLLPGAVFGREEGVWFWAEVNRVRIERFLVTEDGIRAEFNAWAAIVEETVDQPATLMEYIVQSRQLFTLIGPLDAARALAFTLAQATRGIVQVDEAGWYDGDGTVLADSEEADGG